MNNQITILVVDDDETILSSMVDILRLKGYRLLMAANGVQAMNVLQHHIPDLILSDIAMPEMDGYQFFEAVRENPAWVTIPFIFLTARGQQKDIRLGYGLGVDHYITKPFEPDDVLVAVENRLQRTAAIQAATRDEVEHTKQQLMTAFGHELRTPLTYIYGYVSLLQEGHDDMSDEVLDKVLGDAQLGVERLIRLIEDLMLLVNIDSGLTALEIRKYRKEVGIAQSIGNAMRKLRTKAERWNLSFVLPTDEDLVINGMPDYVESIFERLIDNAIKFSKPGGRITVMAEIQDGFGVISVHDDGIGIAPDQQKHLFTRFRQIDRQKREQQGVGIGLAIVEGLTQLHGGRIDVVSQPDEGSTFTVWLPIAQEAESDPGR